MGQILKQFVKEVILDFNISREVRTQGIDALVADAVQKKAGVKSILIGNRTFDITRTRNAEIQAFITAGRKIQAIKLLRALTNTVMKEAKNAVEDFGNFDQPDPTSA